MRRSRGRSGEDRGAPGTRLIPEKGWIDSFTDGYPRDRYFAPIWEAVLEGKPSTPTDPHDRYYEAGGILFRYHPIHGAQLCVPEGEALNRVLGAAHDDNDTWG